MSRNLNINKRFGIFTQFFNLGKKETIIKRRYMKVQDLMAIIGGFVKAVMLIFGFFAETYSKFKNISKIGDKLDQSTVDVVQSNNESADIRIAREARSNAIEKKLKGQEQLSFWSYYCKCWRVSETEKKAKEYYLKILNYVHERLDIEYFLEHFNKFDEMAKIVLNEEQVERMNTIRQVMRL